MSADDDGLVVGPGERMAFLGIWAGELLEALGGPPVYDWSDEDVAAAVRRAEEALVNIWPQNPSIPVVARTALYSVLEQLWAAIPQPKDTPDA